MLLMSSIIVTVLPTPAPPKRPILPPLANGQMRSITLMPVSSSSCDGDSSSNAGALRWIDIVFSASTGPRSSIGRPSTSMMRPSVSAPTGTMIGAPVLTTFMPRRRPSELPSAIVRTTPSPSCCCDFEREPDLVHLERVVDLRGSGRAGIPRRRPRRCTERWFLDSWCSSEFVRFVQFGLSRLRAQTAAAPPTISDSSLVIAACRVLL